MRVLFVTHSFPRWSGDTAGSFVLRLACALSDNGCNVLVIAPSAADLAHVDAIDGIKVQRYRYAPKSWETLAYTGTMAEQVGGSVRGKVALAGLVLSGRRAVRAAVASFAPTVVHAHWWFPSGLCAAGVTGVIPLVTTLHGSDVRLARTNAWAPALFRRVVRCSAAVTAASTWLAAEAREMAPRLEAAIEPMPVDVDLFTPSREARGSRFLFVGRLNPQKGVGLLLEATAAMQVKAELDIVGDGPARGNLERMARDLGLAGRVVFRGHLPQSELVRFYRSASALVLPGENEGLGLVAVEAQLCEAPVIALQSGGTPDVVTDRATGILVAPNDPRALAAAMDSALGRPDLASGYGRAGRAAALARFSPLAVAARYQHVYRQVVTRVA